jgi:hypothetical protein
MSLTGSRLDPTGGPKLNTPSHTGQIEDFAAVSEPSVKPGRRSGQGPIGCSDVDDFVVVLGATGCHQRFRARPEPDQVE